MCIEIHVIFKIQNENTGEYSDVESMSDSDQSDQAENQPEEFGLFVPKELVLIMNKCSEFQEMVLYAMEILEEQGGYGNTKFPDKFISGSARTHFLMEKIQHRRNQRTMLLT